MEPDSDLRLRAGHREKADDKKNDIACPSAGHVNTEDMKKNHSSIGRTPEGIAFHVPGTREMVESLLDPKEKKSFFDMLTLAIMAVEIGLFFVLPHWLKQGVFVVIFFFWRLAYNVGLGVLLKHQSDSRGLVKLAKEYKVFDRQANPKIHDWLKYQLSMKMNSDYNFDTAPLEYNTWLLFRQLVDLILMNDFTSYICFALSWFNTSPQSIFVMGDALRWCGGLFLVVFNIWVKVDAQRVVKDFAWYWGDFFFLIEQSLTFDGVFEMAPHPMYSIGYFGYYGISLMCASYMVLFVSIAAHALQFAFLVLVETPHIEKIYNPPAAPRRQPLAPSDTSMPMDEDAASIIKDKYAARRGFYTHYFRRDLIVFKNFDLCRATDLSAAVVMLYAFIVPLLIPGKTGLVVAVAQAFLWRVFHTYGLGWLLKIQSSDKAFTRQFVKWGGGVQEAFQNWKNIFNLSLSMTYVTFFVACLKMYSLPDNWTYGTTLLRHTLGLVFIALHIWTSVSIYEVLGDYGWFYGDFFIEDQAHQLLYSGIYRFLNNPEKIIGHAAFWGMTLMANSWIIYVLTLFSQISNILFLHYIEAPHMRKLYGDEIRKEAGLTKTLRTAAISIPKSLPDKLQQQMSSLVHETTELQAIGQTFRELFEKIEKTVEDTAGRVGDVMEAARPGLQEVLEETRQLLDQSRSRVIPLVAKDIARYNISEYGVTMVEKSGAFSLGQSIELEWSAPENHGPKDWIGIYKATANKSKHITNISSQGKWHWVNGAERKGVYHFPPDVPVATAGKMIFKGDQLPWEIGTYEFRYHHDGMHNVMAHSITFEIVKPPKPSDMNEALQRSLLKYVQNALGNDPARIPLSAEDEYIQMTDQEAKRVVYAIKEMLGVEFASEVVLADRCIADLVKRIQGALEALSPMQMSSLRRVSLGHAINSTTE